MKARVFGVMVVVMLSATGAVADTPNVPTGLIAKVLALDPPLVRLTWNNSGASIFKVYRSVGDSLHLAPIGASLIRTFEDASVLPGVTYYYAITALGFRDTVLVESERTPAVRAATMSFIGGPRGVIAGTVTDQGTGQPILRAPIRIARFDLAASSLFAATTDSVGRFRAVVDTGRYIVRVEGPPSIANTPLYRSEWFDNAAEPAQATPVHVGSGDSVVLAVGLAHFSVTPYAYINGTVRDTLGLPIAGASVAVFRSLQTMATLGALSSTPPGLGAEAMVLPGLGFARGVVWSGFANATGEFHAFVPAGGSYILMGWKEGYRAEFFGGTVDPTRARILRVRSDTSGIDLTLRVRQSHPGRIRGSARDSVGESIAGRVILFPRPREEQIESPVLCVQTDDQGSFEMADVEPATYSLLFVPYSDYAPAFYRSASYGVPFWQDADTVHVGAGAVADIVLGVQPVISTGAVRVSGAVTAAGNGPVAGARILARAGGKTVGYGITDGAGEFLMEALAPGAVSLAIDRTGFARNQTIIAVPPGVSTVSGLTFLLNGGSPTGMGEGREFPEQVHLWQNYPNPFNPTTVIRYQLPVASEVRLTVYDMLGREVSLLVDERKGAGNHEVNFNAAGMASGVYVYRLTAGALVQIRKMILIR